MTKTKTELMFAALTEQLDRIEANQQFLAYRIARNRESFADEPIPLIEGEWLTGFPVAVLPPLEDWPVHAPLGHAITLRDGRYRELLPVTRTSFWGMDHRNRYPTGAEHGISNRNAKVYYIDPIDGDIRGRSSGDTWIPGDETSTWDVDMTVRYLFAGVLPPLDPHPDLYPAELPQLPPVPVDVRDGDVLAWWPILSGATAMYWSIVWYDGDLYASINGMEPKPGSWLLVTDLIGLGYRIGEPVDDGVFPPLPLRAATED